jgi:hypothetical protein
VTIGEYLEADHRRLDALLAGAIGGDGAAYERFRAGLLRHIGLEEKILLPAAKRLAGAPLPQAAMLRADHGALAALLVPTPTPAILARISAILKEHNPLEEGTAGAYAACARLAGDEADAILAQLRAAPEPPLAPHFDGPRAFENIERLVSAAAALRIK